MPRPSPNTISGPFGHLSFVRSRGPGRHFFDRAPGFGPGRGDRHGDTHLAWMYRDDDRMATPLDPQLWLNWVFEPSDAGDSTVHASFMLNSYHEPGEMTAAEAAETLETLVRWSE